MANVNEKNLQSQNKTNSPVTWLWEARNATEKKILTRMPVFVASLTASINVSYFGLKARVNAQSMIRPME